MGLKEIKAFIREKKLGEVAKTTSAVSRYLREKVSEIM